VLGSSRIKGFAASLYILFLPLTGAPYILWLVDNEGQEPEEYFKDQYSGRGGLMVRSCLDDGRGLSSLSLAAAILILGTFAVVLGLFK
jgi:hypothetical protein